MEDLLDPYFTWTNLLVAALLLWGIYWLLVMLQRRLASGVFFGRYQGRITAFVRTFLLLYEPITVLVLLLVFFFINPLMHGIFLVLLILAGFGRLRDYLSGRILLATSLVEEGRRMKTEKGTGVISRIGRVGLYLQTGEKLSFVNYSNLVTEGYSLTTSDEVGGYYQLNLTHPESTTTDEALRFLADKFLLTPYLTPDFRPELIVNDRDGDQRRINARVAIREERQLRELIDLIEEWNYQVRVARK